MEIVTKEQYWIDILNDNSKFGQITTEDASFNLRANDVWKVVENTLLDTEDEEEIMNWERITQLDSGELTIFQRKVNILYTLCEKNYIPLSLVRKIVEKTTGKDDIKCELYFDKEQNKFIVHTDRADENTLEDGNSIINQILPKGVELERYNHNIEIGWECLNKYTNCTNTTDIITINPDYKTDLSSDGEWVYKLDSLTSGSKMFENCATLSTFSSELPSLTNASSMFYRCSALPSFNINLPSVTTSMQMFENCKKLTSFSGALPKLSNANYMFNGDDKLINFSSELPKLSSAIGMFILCKLGKASTIKICSSLPSYTSGTHNITIGIHVDHQSDEEVLAAIDNATAKGWTVTTQWNGTVTTSTYSLRPTQSQAIYAKYESEELGMYIDANNVRYSVNWGHMISSPDGKSPDELGYQEFASLEEALTTWGLTEIMEISEQES